MTGGRGRVLINKISLLISELIINVRDAQDWMFRKVLITEVQESAFFD